MHAFILQVKILFNISDFSFMKLHHSYSPAMDYCMSAVL